MTFKTSGRNTKGDQAAKSARSENARDGCEMGVNGQMNMASEGMNMLTTKQKEPHLWIPVNTAIKDGSIGDGTAGEEDALSSHIQTLANIPSGEKCEEEG
ncbi:uncharacterized protein SPSK_01316 [Sporothrix schenckii 1099-18]|uniref:Uncharacterized protein n=1 Tax=Sporothrix schenckii 1099-18 TaxID=1397361 RepID=A0A0F2LVL2_SPOSC|nr:uncharacterized protein SPSK_01316 [Sporothrix schenckii 1099-18]KJR81502.1 hypothetical protein SPSK_01316 [Sporothrix schenckii 1099-18]